MWIIITDTEGTKHLINCFSIMDVSYHSKSNLTEIVFLRSAYPPVWCNGNCMEAIKKCVSLKAPVKNVGD